MLYSVIMEWDKVEQANNAWFVVSALALKLRTKVLTTNLFTHQTSLARVLVMITTVITLLPARGLRSEFLQV
jgi:hypothetical protein